MYFTARERNLLFLLTGAEQQWSVKALAQSLAVSERTIHRDLAGLERIMDDFGLSLRKRAGVGVSLEGNASGFESLRAALAATAGGEFTPEERKIYLLCTLLERSEPVKLAALALDLRVASATVSYDLEHIRDWLESFGLTLVKKRGWGIAVTGEENRRRAAMRSLLAEHFDEAEILSLLKKNLNRQTADPSGLVMERLLGLVEREKIAQVEETVKQAISKLPYSLAAAAYIGLVVHLALALERIEKGETLRFDPALLQELQQTREYEVAQKIAAGLRTVFGQEFPEAEIANIVLHLRGAKRGTDRGYWFEEGTGTVMKETGELIRYVENETGVPLSKDPSLIQGLLAHLERALYRLKENLPIHNPLLHRIEQDYPGLFATITAGMAETFSGYRIPREEIGYLVMHFGAALERWRRGSPIRALVVCASGIGTSKLLASRLQTEFPEIARVEEAAFDEVRQMDLHAYDLVLSTIPLERAETDYIRVHPYLTETDADRIRAHLNEKQRKRAQEPERDEWMSKGESTGIEAIERIQEVTEAILTILRGYFLSFLSAPSLSPVLDEACKQLIATGVLQETATVIEALEKRERLGGLGIPGTAMALFHARSEAVQKPSFTMYDLDQPLQVEGMDGKPLSMSRLLLLLAPMDGNEFTPELLSRISVLIIESPVLFQSGSEEEIRSFLAEQLNRILHEEMK
ncbi:BglG family transcription antiterminator [Desmospora activa]|uniref:BglG family transcriptional antiterminator n=1 Tax=Desmospora activa DSM 45169 TaxID=1121389 RepID=A0A2T4ZAD8_9BACL|nr:BglG family transcription antiterminator [Desmospora activa]PTM58864.1 BglG family transcriptional antiterminator [Desmospora activa DSM 45169]